MGATRQVVTVIVPVLNRPERVEPLLASLTASQKAVELRPLFVVSPDDAAQQEAVQASEADWMLVPFSRGNGDYARKVNRAAAHLRGAGVEWVFLGADDLCFCHGWADEALAVAALAPLAQVIGTNDLGNPAVRTGQHSTHSLVRTGYLDRGTADEPEGGKLLHEGYHHNWVDNEFVATARDRGVFVFAAHSWVEHLHPSWGKAVDDATYRLGLADFHVDGALFRARERLWR